jgi:putative RNA 2'-phosphotransferase
MSPLLDPAEGRRLSKRLSYALRHHPEALGLTLDPQGWVAVDTLLAALIQEGLKVDRAALDELVSSNDKQRFAYSPDGHSIRASQGHSVPIELGYQALTPPAALYHGTVAKVLPAIQREGLHKGQRHHVHLSTDRETASRVGGRRGKPVILLVDAAAMHADGHAFFCSENGVWLTEAVPPQYLRES